MPWLSHGELLFGDIVPVSPFGHRSPPERVPAQRRSPRTGTGETRGCSGGLQEPNSLAVGRDTSLRGPLDGHAKSPRASPGPFPPHEA